MVHQELFDNGTDGLVTIMKELQNVNKQIAIIYYEINGDTKEIEDDFDYMEAQRSINAAIRQVGQILGNVIAEKFF